MEEHDPTMTREEALALLRKHRSELIMDGRVRAVRLCAEEGTCHTRRVYEEMLDDIRLRDRMKEVESFWLSAIFTKKLFVWTGQWHTYVDQGKCNGPNYVKIWRLRAPEAR